MLIDLLSKFLLVTGVFFFFVGTLGVIRFPDALTRAHGSTKCDTLGAVLCLLALILQSGISFVSLKLILVIIFIWITNPTAAHLIARGIVVGNSKKECDK